MLADTDVDVPAYNSSPPSIYRTGKAVIENAMYILIVFLCVLVLGYAFYQSAVYITYIANKISSFWQTAGKRPWYSYSLGWDVPNSDRNPSPPPTTYGSYTTSVSGPSKSKETGLIVR